LDEVQVLRAGIIEHNIVSDFMKVMQKKRINDEIIDTIIIVEHPEIVTIGAKSRREEVQISSDYKKIDVDRGGGITWHGPGQLVVYPIIKWGTKEQSIRKIIGKFEQLVISSLLILTPLPLINLLISLLEVSNLDNIIRSIIFIFLSI
jgi:lipoyl(octanoyl) transferase